MIHCVGTELYSHNPHSVHSQPRLRECWCHVKLCQINLTHWSGGHRQLKSSPQCWLDDNCIQVSMLEIDHQPVSHLQFECRCVAQDVCSILPYCKVPHSRCRRLKLVTWVFKCFKTLPVTVTVTSFGALMNYQWLLQSGLSMLSTQHLNIIHSVPSSRSMAIAKGIYQSLKIVRA